MSPVRARSPALSKPFRLKELRQPPETALSRAGQNSNAKDPAERQLDEVGRSSLTVSVSPREGLKMARSSKPWFNQERGCWMVWWNGRRVRLVDGKSDKATEKRARDKLADLRYEARHNPAADSEPTVASVIDAYIASASKRLAQSTQDAHFPYLQSFAEGHGWRPVREASPVHVEQWLFDHSEWVSDWTKNLAVR